MGEPKLYTKSGELTNYAMRCGYIYRYEIYPTLDKTPYSSISVTFEYDTVFHIKVFDFHNHKRILWESYMSLTECKHRYYEISNLLGVNKDLATLAHRKISISIVVPDIYERIKLFTDIKE